MFFDVFDKKNSQSFNNEIGKGVCVGVSQNLIFRRRAHFAKSVTILRDFT